MPIISETADVGQSATARRCRVHGCRHRSHDAAITPRIVHEGHARHRDGLFYVSATLEPIYDENGAEQPAAGLWSVDCRLTVPETGMSEAEAGALARAIEGVAAWCRAKNQERYPAPATVSALDEEAQNVE